MVKGKVLSTLGLIMCWVYLMACITYDILDKQTMPEVNDPGRANPLLYCIPLYLLMDTLIFCAYSNFKKYGKYHEFQWFGFIMLSASQTTKNIFFNPTIQTFNDYFYLAVIIIYVIFRLVKKKK